MARNNNPHRPTLDDLLLRLRYEANIISTGLVCAAAAFGVALLAPAWLVLVLCILTLSAGLLLGR